jgi:hypothetical protein
MKNEAFDPQLGNEDFLDPHIAALIEEETKRQIMEVYDGLYYDFIMRPKDLWEDEKIAKKIEIETLEEMVQIYSDHEQYEKCATVQSWIDSIETSKGLLAIKQLL